MVVQEYIRHRQNTVVQFISTLSLLYLCEGLERPLGAQVGMRWWEQVIIDMAGSQEAAAVERRGARDKSGGGK